MSAYIKLFTVAASVNPSRVAYLCAFMRIYKGRFTFEGRRKNNHKSVRWSAVPVHC